MPKGSKGGREDAGVIEHQAISGTKMVGKAAKNAMVDGPAGAVEDQQAGLVALRQGLLGDEPRRQVVIEIRGLHDSSFGPGTNKVSLVTQDGTAYNRYQKQKYGADT